MAAPKGFLEAGRVVATHGVRGAMRVEVWCDSVDFLLDVDRLFIGGEQYKVLAASEHKGQLLCSLEGVNTMDDAIRFKGKVVLVSRDDVDPGEGRYFIADLVGLEVRDAARGTLGRIKEVLTLPANNVYVVEGEGKTYMIPAVDEFIRHTDIEGGYVEVELIDGMEA